METEAVTDESSAKRIRMHSNQQVSKGIRLRADFLTLEYRPDKPMLKSIRKKTSHLAKMGVRRKDGDFLYIEEALWLAELGAALVVDQCGKALSIAQLFTLLDRSGVSLMKYAVYTHLLRAGYVVRRPKPVESNQINVEEYPLKSSAFHFPKEMLDQFPSISNSAEDPSAMFLKFSSIQVSTNFTAVFDPDDADKIDLNQLNVLTDTLVKKNERKLLSGLRLQAREPWADCRPRWWPSFHLLRDAESWRVYSDRRTGLLRKRTQKRQPTQKRVSPFDFEVFTDCSTASEPAYCVIAVDQRFPESRPNFAEINALATESAKLKCSLLVASGVPTCLKFNQFGAEDEQTLAVPME